MIPLELCARIWRLFLAEHWKVGTIAAELGVHHETVMRAIEADRFVRPDALVRRSLLDPYRAFVTETLEQHPRLRATRLLEMIQGAATKAQPSSSTGTWPPSGPRRGARRTCACRRCRASRPRWRKKRS